MAKNRRKKRRKKPSGQAPAPQPQVQRPGRVAPEARPDVVAARPSGPGTEGTVVGTVVEVEREFIWLDVGGVRSMLYASELMLGIGERPADRYAVGDRFEAFVFQMGPEPDLGATQFSIRRASPYPEALAGLEVGAEVQATVVNTYDAGIELDVGGVRGNVFHDELPLQPGESPRQRYEPGETIESVLVWGIDQGDRGLALSVKRKAPGYLEALRRRAVGDVVSATVTVFQSNGGLWLDVDGLVGGVAPWELDLAKGESAWERYAIGKTIDGLFVWQVNHEDRRDLVLSVKRNAPGYLEALQQRAVGDVVSATVTAFWGNGRGLWLEVDGVVGALGPQDLDLADGESVRDHYAVGETIDGLFVWQVNHEDRRDLVLSVKRNAPGYLEALQQRAVGDVVSATVTAFWGNGRGLWLEVDGVVGALGPQDLDLADGESVRDHYAVGETIDGLFVWQVNHEDRRLVLSVKRNAPGYVEALDAITRGDELDGIVAQANKWGIWLGAAGVVGWIPISELALNEEESPQTRYAAGDPITARVWLIDHEARDITLSVRQLAAGFAEGPISLGAEISVTVRGTTPRDVRMPIRVLTMYSDSRVEIPPHALSLSTGMPPRFEDNQVIRVVVVELDDEGRPTRLSHRQALEGWEAEMQRLSHNTVVPNARPVPPEALSDAELRAGAAAVDLGPITGFIPEDELDRETGRHIATYNETYRVVVESVDYERRIAIVSHDRFEERWRELAAGFEVGAEVAGELREVEGRVALLDLGSGLLAEMPVEQLPARTEGDGAEQGRIGNMIIVRIKSIEAETYAITAEIKNYDLVQMIAEDETLDCELKKVFLASVQPESPSARRNRQDVNRSVVRAMAGMMNRDGGHVIVGVEDTDKKDGDVVGWEASGWENQNAMATALSNLVGRVLSAAAGGLFEARFERLPNGHEILDIVCKRADEPIFLSDGQREEFPVRFPAMTKNLTAREQHEYIQGRFYGRKVGVPLVQAEGELL